MFCHQVLRNGVRHICISAHTKVLVSTVHNLQSKHPVAETSTTHVQSELNIHSHIQQPLRSDKVAWYCKLHKLLKRHRNGQELLSKQPPNFSQTSMQDSTHRQFQFNFCHETMVTSLHWLPAIIPVALLCYCDQPLWELNICNKVWNNPKDHTKGHPLSLPHKLQTW